MGEMVNLLLDLIVTLIRRDIYSGQLSHQADDVTQVSTLHTYATGRRRAAHTDNISVQTVKTTSKCCD